VHAHSAFSPKTASASVPRIDVSAGTALLYPVSLVGAFGYVGTCKLSTSASSELQGAADTTSADGERLVGVKFMCKQRAAQSKSVATAHALERDFLASIAASNEKSTACLPKLVRCAFTFFFTFTFSFALTFEFNRVFRFLFFPPRRE
jgi:hypothetical protein